MRSQLFTTLAIGASLASAHFQVLYPPQGMPFNDEEEATGPCGGPDPEITDSTVDAPVDRFAISVRSGHPEGSWSIRGTTSTSAPYNFTDISMVETQGIGDWCLTYFSAPSEWAGSSGIIQIVDNAPDGMLYQCTPVNFVEGANSTVGPACTNSSSSFQASFVSEGSSESASPSGTMSMSHAHDHEASATGEAASSTPAQDAAAMVTGVGALAGLGMVVAGLAL